MNSTHTVIFFAFWTTVIPAILAGPTPEQIQFIDTKLAPVLKMIKDRSLPYPDINKRIEEQDEIFLSKFEGKSIKINLQSQYHPKSKLISSIPMVRPTGEPSIVLLIPAIMDGYGGNQIFLVLMLMHERYNLTLIDVAEGHTPTLNNEIRVYAIMMERVTAPLREKYKVLLPRGDQSHYDEWIIAGRSAESPSWQEYMRKLTIPILPVLK